MARPVKAGLCYFPLDTDFLSDRKIQRLIQKYGSSGIATYVAILCEAYGTNGYYARYTDEFCFDIGFTVRLEEQLVMEVVDFCVKVRLFDVHLLETKRILTSKGMQQRFREISKRGSFSILPELEIKEEEFPRMDVNSPNQAITPQKCAITPPKEAITPQNEAITPSNEVKTAITPLNEAITPPNEAKIAITPPNEVVTPVFEAITPLNINGNKKINTSDTKNQFLNGIQSSNNNGDTARRAEILHMAAMATKGH